MVLDGKVDFAINNFGITKERMNSVDFLIFGKGGMGRIYVQNPKDGLDWKVYTKPLNDGAWKWIVLFFLVVPVPMMIVALGSRFKYNAQQFIPSPTTSQLPN